MTPAPVLLHRRMADSLRAGGPVHVVSDFDGTLSAFVADPESAQPVPSAVPALRRLASIEGVRVSICTGRPLGFVSRFFPTEIDLYASYGLQTRIDGVVGGPDLEPWRASLESFARRITSAVTDVGGRVTTSAAAAERDDALYLERKPTGVAVHDGPARSGNPQSKSAVQLRRAVETLGGNFEGLIPHENNGNFEFLVPLPVDKGSVIRGLDGLVVFSGDDSADIKAAIEVRQRDGRVLVVDNPADAVRRGTPKELLALADEVFHSQAEHAQYLEGLAKEVEKSLSQGDGLYR